MDEDKLLKWLTSEETMELHDRIESVSRPLLRKYVNENDFVCVFFYDNRKHKKAESDKILVELENIDDDAEAQGIDFLKSHDLKLAHEYGIQKPPGLVLIRKDKKGHNMLKYDGDLLEEENVLKWLLKNKHSEGGSKKDDHTDNDEDDKSDQHHKKSSGSSNQKSGNNKSNTKHHDVIEDVDRNAVEKLIKSQDYVTVLFYDKEAKQSTNGELRRVAHVLKSLGSVQWALAAEHLHRFFLHFYT